MSPLVLGSHFHIWVLDSNGARAGKQVVKRCPARGCGHQIGAPRGVNRKIAVTAKIPWRAKTLKLSIQILLAHVRGQAAVCQLVVPTSLGLSRSHGLHVVWAYYCMARATIDHELYLLPFLHILTDPI